MNTTTNDVGNKDADGPTITLHPVGKYGHWMMLGLAALSWAGQNFHFVGDQAQGTIQVTIGGLAIAKVAALLAARPK